MPCSLLRTIYSLAKYESPDTPLRTEFLDVRCNCLNGKSIAIIKAADRLIGSLFTYGSEISLGDKYFQPIFYTPKRSFIRFLWIYPNTHSFCNGCFRNNCRISKFSSRCPRFHTAWAIEHITAAADKLVARRQRKESQCSNKFG